MRFLKNIFLFSAFFILFNLDLCAKYEIETIFGKICIDEPIVEKIIKSSAMQRLKYIDQSGTLYYLGYMPKYSRYDHSLGVYALLKKYNVDSKEQIAGLLHDVSHTVFSHVADILFKDFSQDVSYQDDIHEWFLEKMNMQPLLNEVGLSIQEISLTKNNFLALDQELPALCADRIEYLLHTGLILGKITKEDINFIIKNLKYEKNKWFFVDIEAAKKIGFLSLYLTEELYGAPWNYVLYFWSAEFLKRALTLKLITLDDIHFGYDEQVLKKVIECEDKIIQCLFNKIKNPSKHYKVIKERYDVLAKPKFRGVNPLIYVNEKWILLSHIDKQFKKKFDNVKRKIQSGIKIKFTN